MRQSLYRACGLHALAALAVLGLAAGLAACGGGGGGDATIVAPPPLAIGADGGKVEVPGVATVVVPPGALDAQTTIRVAQDSSAAPPVPAWFTPAGPMVAITPHGASFPEPVTVRLPAPTVTLADNERLLIAKAQPGGEWEVFSDTVEKDGQLEVQVNSFSIFVPVKVPFTVTVGGTVLQVPFALSPMTVECNGAPCAARERVQATPMAATSTGNGGVFPTGCVDPKIQLRRYTSSVAPVLGTQTASAAGIFRFGFVMPATDYLRDFIADTLRLEMSLLCTDQATNGVSRLVMSQGRVAVDSLGRQGLSLAIVEFPTAWTHAPGDSVTVRAVFSGGASATDSFAAPTATDQARIYWERLAPGDSAWRTVSEQDQTSANSRPYAGQGRAWMYWSLDFSLGPLAATDTGASYRVRACYQRPGSSSSSCKIGPAATLTVVQQALAPSFTTQPRSVLIQPGQTASFNAQVAGTPAPTLQWQLRASGSTGNWVDLPSNGATGNYTTPPIPLADNGVQYRLLASNSAGSVASDIVTVSVSAAMVPPAIGTQPASLTVVRGSEALLAVNATGTEALSYQWFKGGAAITGANAPQLKIANASDADAGSYSVEISNAAGRVSSASAQLIVTNGAATAVAPTIVTQPAAVAVTEGNVATFAVGVNGSGPMAFQWRRNGVDIAGANAAAYTLSAVAIADGGNYSVRVSNSAGNATSQSATLAVAPVGSGPPAVQAPVLVATQDSIVVAPGMDAMFGVTVQGSGPLSYRWLRNGVAVAGQDTAVYVINGASALDAGTYQVEISNSAGTVASATSTVMLLGAPAITSQPVAVSFEEGMVASFNVAATGDAVRYQWLRNNVAIAGATDTTYATPPLTLADHGAVFSVIAYNGAGLVLSSGALLTVTPAAMAPTVAQEPADVTVAEGTPANLDVAFNGTPPLTVQFQRFVGGNWVDYTSAVTWNDNGMRRVATGNLGVADSGAQFRFVATNAAGSATTRTVTVTVSAAPVVATGSHVGKLSLGFKHSCAVTADARLACWGYNSSRQIGQPNPQSPSYPTPAIVPLAGAVTGVAAGQGETCAIHNGGQMSCWGSIGGTHIPTLQTVAGTVSGIALSYAHRCFIAAGNVYCAGDNTWGQLGQGTAGVGTATPLRVADAVAGGSTPVALAGGTFHTCALASSGEVRCWGRINTQTDASGNPVATPTPTTVAGLPAVVDIGAGNAHTCATAVNGSMWCWGANAAGQQGNSSTSATFTTAAAEVEGVSNIVALGVGADQTCAVQSDGRVRCWGTGQMGNGDVTTTQATPSLVAGLTDARTVAVASGQHVCVLTTARGAKCWGSNAEGQAGQPTFAPYTTPTVVSGSQTFWWAP